MEIWVAIAIALASAFGIGWLLGRSFERYFVINRKHLGDDGKWKYHY